MTSFRRRRGRMSQCTGRAFRGKSTGQGIVALEQLEPRLLLNGAFEITPVAIRLDPAPGFGQGVVYDSFNLAGIGAGKHVGFRADVVDFPSGNNRTRGLFVGAPEAVGLIYRQGDNAPGAAAPFFEVPFSFPVRGAGAIAVSALIDIGSTAPHGGVWAGTGAISPVKLPDVGGSVGGGIVVNAAGQTPATHRGVLYIGSSEAIGIQAAGGDALDLPPTLNRDDYNLNTFSSSVTPISLINSAGQVPVLVRASGKPGIPHYNGLWLVGPGGDWTEVISGRSFSSNEIVGLNDAGQVLVRYTAETIGNQTISALGIVEAGTLTEVIRADDTLPGAAPTVRPSMAGSLSGGGHVAIYGRDTTLFKDAGIWTGTAGSLVKLAGLGDPAPGMESAVFSDFGGFNINSSGVVAFTARVNGGQRDGIWVGTPGNLKLVVGEELTYALSDGRAVILDGIFTDSWNTLSGIEDGKRALFNDEGILAFQGNVRFTSFGNSQMGIFAVDLNTPVLDTGAIQGVVWSDDNDGIFDFDESGLSGIEVLLKQNNQTIDTAITDGSGLYRFDGLEPGSYRIEVVAPQGAFFGPTGGDAEVGSFGTNFLVAGGSEIEADAALVAPGRIYGVVWADNDGDGLRDQDEPGVAGVAVRLFNSSGQLMAGPINTDANGAYFFQNLANGTYQVRITAPADATFTPSGGDAEIGITGQSVLLNVVQGANIEADAGLVLSPPQADLKQLIGHIAGDALTIDIDELTTRISRELDDTLLLVVEYKDTSGIARDSLLATTTLVITSFNMAMPPIIARSGAFSRGDQNAMVTYSMEPPSGQWTGLDVGDYLVHTTADAVEDETGVKVPAGTLLGLFSIVDQARPTAELSFEFVSTDSLSIGPNRKDNPVGVLVRFNDNALLDSTSFGEGNLQWRRVSTGETKPMKVVAGPVFENGGKTAEGGYSINPPPGGFTVEDEGRYEIITGVNAVEDTSGNTVVAGAVLLAAVVDFTRPEAKLLAGSPQKDAVQFQFAVEWSDALSGVQTTSTHSGGMQASTDILRVRTPNGDLLPVRNVDPPLTFDSLATEEQLTINYVLDAPGGAWDEADVGIYTVEVGTIPVRDGAGNSFVVGANIGTFAFDRGVTIEGDQQGGITFATQSGSFSLTSDDTQFIMETVGQELAERQLKKGVKAIDGVTEGLGNLFFASTSPNASVQLKGKGEPVDIENFTGAGTFKDINLGAGNILGDFDLSEGTAKKITINHVMDDHFILIGPPADGVTSVVVILDRVANTTLISQTPIAKLIVTEWIDDGGDPDQIIAPWIGQIIVKGDKKLGLAGDFEADVILSGAGAPKGITLGKVSIAGSLRESVWEITGDVNSVQVNGDTEDWVAAVTGNVKSLAIKRQLSGALTANAAAKIASDSINAFALTLNQAVDPKLVALGKLTAKQRIDGLLLRSAGHVGAIAGGAIFDSSLFAGVAEEVVGLPDGLEDFSAEALIKSVKIKGIKTLPFSVAATNIAARNLGAVQLAGVNPDNDGTPFGLVASAFKSVKIKDPVLSLSKPEHFADLPAFGDGMIVLV